MEEQSSASLSLAKGASTSRSGASFLLDLGDVDLIQGLHWSLIESAPDAIVVSDEQGLICLVNAQTEKIFGYSRDELLGEPIEKLVPGRFRHAHVRHRNEYKAAPRTRPMETGRELYGLKRDGSELTIEISLSSVATGKRRVVCAIIRDVSGRIAAQKARRQMEFETALAGLSAVFINLSPEYADQEITNGLKTLARAVDGHRATLAQMEATSGDFLVTHCWADEGYPEFPKRFVRGILPWLTGRIKAGETVCLEKPEDLPPEARGEKEYMESLGVVSTLVVPVYVGGKLTGGMSCDAFGKHQKWDAALISRVKGVADIFANALARKQADESLRQAYAEIHELKEQLEKENAYLREEIDLEQHHNAVVGNSAAIRAVLKKAEQVASTDSTVLILGETGTGKELIARTIHEMSGRNKRPMVKTNCAALPATLIESELFGREKGAYTGALAREIGRFELADQSTIFLDEIGEIPPEVQSKLLRMLQEGQFERLGSAKTIEVNVRVIAATSRNLQAMVKDGKFREDLFYRLNVFPIVIPPLRERPEDIPALVWHILKELGARMGRNVEGVHAKTMREFQRYSWPGNVRELRNIIERNLILSTGPILQAEFPELEQTSNRGMRRLDEMEAEYFLSVLQSTRWRVRGTAGAAEVLGLKPTTLEAKLKKLGIRRPP
jgi:formate hydrogenlyase transcriptional activator